MVLSTRTKTIDISPVSSVLEATCVPLNFMTKPAKTYFQKFVSHDPNVHDRLSTSLLLKNGTNLKHYIR